MGVEETGVSTVKFVSRKPCYLSFPITILYLEGKSPLLSNIQVNFGDILPETCKSSAFWDMGVDSHIKWLLLFSPNEGASWDSLCIDQLLETPGGRYPNLPASPGDWAPSRSLPFYFKSQDSIKYNSRTLHMRALTTHVFFIHLECPFSEMNC